MNAIIEILEHIFSACEYKVNKSYQFDLIVEKNHVQTIIQIGKPSLDDILAFANTQTSENKLYITPESISDNYKHIAQENGVCVWDREILEANLGKVILADAQGSCKEIELSTSIPHKAHKEDGESEFTLFKSIMATRSTTRDEITDESCPDIISNMGNDAPPLQQPEIITNTLNINTTPLKLNRDAAIAIGRKEVSRPKDAVLLFIPFWSYRYSFDIDKKFKSKIVNLSSNKSGVVNAVNGFMEQWDIDEILTEIDVPYDYEIKGQTVSRDDVQAMIIKEAISKNTKTVGFNSVKGQEIISENHTIKPEAHEIAIDIELVYIPVWDVKGISNSVLINATTHQIFSNPVDDDAEFV